MEDVVVNGLARSLNAVMSALEEIELFGIRHRPVHSRPRRNISRFPDAVSLVPNEELRVMTFLSHDERNRRLKSNSYHITMGVIMIINWR